MWFLALEISALLVLAAICGGFFTYWWMRRHYEDVSGAHSRLMEEAAQARDDRLTRHEFDNGLAGLRATLGDMTQPQMDLTPVADRLGTLDAKLAATGTQNETLAASLASLQDALSEVSATTGRLTNTNTGPLEERLDRVTAAISERPAPNLTPLETRISGLESAIQAIAIPEIELGPIHSGLTRLELAMSALDKPLPDLSPDFSILRGDIASLQEKVMAERDTPPPDLSADFGMLRGDIASLQEKLTAERSHEEGQTGVQLRELSAALEAMEMPDLAPLQQRLTDIETRIREFRVPSPDLSVLDEGLSLVHGRVASLETSLLQLAPPDPEAGLAPVHQRIDQMQFELARLERMEGALSALRMEVHQGRPNLEALEQQLAMLKNDLSARPEPDLAPVLNSVQAMERRMDIGALENRLTSIEYGLAALHHSLRTRLAADAEPQANAAPVPAVPPPAFQAPPPPEPEPAFRPAPPPPPAAFVAPEAPPAFTPPEPPPAPMPPAFEPATTEPHPYAPPPMPDPLPEPVPEPLPEPLDVIGEVRRPGDEANLLSRPAFGAPDDLEDVSGIGPMLHDLLTELGVYYFWQIGEWSTQDVAWVDSLLDGFNGRIERDDWVGQAKILATGAHAARRP